MENMQIPIPGIETIYQAGYFIDMYLYSITVLLIFWSVQGFTGYSGSCSKTEVFEQL
ncbi:MAG: hypothetical protein LBG24_11235 [Treponema sp.]|jgi:hypothetical protein|nr:hypothetical protein [Treponema sp.]